MTRLQQELGAMPRRTQVGTSGEFMRKRSTARPTTSTTHWTSCGQVNQLITRVLNHLVVAFETSV